MADYDRTDELYLRLLGAREKLCQAQVLLPEVGRKHYAKALDRAVDEIDRVGTFHCPQWSRFDVPDIRKEFD